VAMNGNTLTLGTGNLTSAQIPNLSGTGLFIKTGTGTATLIYSNWSGFTGMYQVDNGVLRGTYPRISSSSTILVNSGATFYITTVEASVSPNITLNGAGYDSQGALRTVDFIYGKAISLASDSSVAVNATQTLTLNGSFSGSGKLTKLGSGKLLIAGDSNGYTADTSVDAGILEVSGLLQNSTITVNTGGTLNAPDYRVGTVILNGGTWNNTAQAEWIKGSSYSGNDSGIWSDTNNWGTLAIPTTLAILGSVTGNGNDGIATRTITNDVATTVGELRFSQASGSYPNVLYLAADLNAGSLTMNPVTWNYYGINIPDGRILTITNDAAAGFPRLYPQTGTAGTIVKEGSGDAKWIYSDGGSWYGTYIARGGVTHLNYDRVNHIAFVVEDGGTLRIDNSTWTGSGSITIGGSGHNGGGAIWVSGSHTMGNRGITVASDALMKIDNTIDNTYTLTLGQPLGGSGVLTLVGGGTLDINSTWNYTIDGASANGIVASTGIVDITDCTLSLTNLVTATATQYVLIDYNNGASSDLVGQFATTNLPEDWLLTYTGTAMHPNAAVLLAPPTGTIILIR